MKLPLIISGLALIISASSLSPLIAEPIYVVTAETAFLRIAPDANSRIISRVTLLESVLLMDKQLPQSRKGLVRVRVVASSKEGFILSAVIEPAPRARDIHSTGNDFKPSSLPDYSRDIFRDSIRSPDGKRIISFCCAGMGVGPYGISIIFEPDPRVVEFRVDTHSDYPPFWCYSFAVWKDNSTVRMFRSLGPGAPFLEEEWELTLRGNEWTRQRIAVWQIDRNYTP